MDLMLWASERGQMLSRTVKGMMMYATALQQLEYIETVDDRGDPDSLAQAVEGKFRCRMHALVNIHVSPRTSMSPFSAPPDARRTPNPQYLISVCKVGHTYRIVPLAVTSEPKYVVLKSLNCQNLTDLVCGAVLCSRVFFLWLLLRYCR
jgi:hypothetical protein